MGLQEGLLTAHFSALFVMHCHAMSCTVLPHSPTGAKRSSSEPHRQGLSVHSGHQTRLTGKQLAIVAQWGLQRTGLFCSEPCINACQVTAASTVNTRPWGLDGTVLVLWVFDSSPEDHRALSTRASCGIPCGTCSSTTLASSAARRRSLIAVWMWLRHSCTGVVVCEMCRCRLLTVLSALSTVGHRSQADRSHPCQLH